jgi:hypothetical protein
LCRTRFATLAPGLLAGHRSNAAFRAGLYNNSVAVNAVSQSGKSIRRRQLKLSAILLALGALSPGAVAADSGYGTLIARGASGTLATGAANFDHVRAPRLFWLVLTDSPGAQIRVSWSISCFDPAHRAHGGAAGQATVARGRWVKRIRANWITRPVFCSGVVRASTDSPPVQIHVYAS